MVVETTVFVSALAGLGSFLSPCILPILPGFISYLSGTAANEAKNSQISKMGTVSYSGGAAGIGGSRTIQPVFLKTSARLNIFLNTVYFVLGFSLVFAVLGYF
jgi:cytochrome c-type biogenesis protein